MIRLLKEKQFDIIQFKPFLDYISFLETQGYTQMTESSNHEWKEENYQNEEFDLKILTFKDNENHEKIRNLINP